MKQFHSQQLRNDLSRIISLAENRVLENELLDMAKNKIDEEENNQSYCIDIEDISFFYYDEKERDNDFETLVSLLPVLEIKHIKSLINSDADAYFDIIELIKEQPNYFTERNNEEQKYWSDWFYGSNMQHYN